MWFKPVRLMDCFRYLVAGTLLAIGTALIGQGGYIQLKAHAASWLIHSTWAERQAGDKPDKPWPWADTWVTARLEVARLGIRQYVMKDASGESLAFGPGQIKLFQNEAKGGPIVIAGHRDTHFKFLRDLRRGDQLQLQRFDTAEQVYEVVSTHVIDSETDELYIDPDQPRLMLVTCWPFNAITLGGPMRYVVVAKSV